MANTFNNKKNYNRKSKKSNKGLFITIGSIFAICMLFLILYPLFEEKHPVYNVSKSKLNPATQAILNNPNYANTISDKQLDTKIDNKEDFFVYMYSAACQYCLETTPELVPLTEQLNIDMDQFNLLEFKNYQSKLKIEYTPTLIYFEDGVEKDRIVGGISVDSATGNTLADFQAFFEKNNVQ